LVPPLDFLPIAFDRSNFKEKQDPAYAHEALVLQKRGEKHSSFLVKLTKRYRDQCNHQQERNTEDPHTQSYLIRFSDAIFYIHG